MYCFQTIIRIWAELMTAVKNAHGPKFLFLDLVQLNVNKEMKTNSSNCEVSFRSFKQISHELVIVCKTFFVYFNICIFCLLILRDCNYSLISFPHYFFFPILVFFVKVLLLFVVFAFQGSKFT